MLSVSFAANAQTIEHKIIVHAQGKTIKLSQADVKYIFSKTTNDGIRETLLSGQQTIRNSDVADNIITIMKAK